MKYRTHLPHQPWAIWFALLVAVLGAIVPTPSRGWLRTTDVLSVDICTSLDPHRLALADTPDSPGDLETSMRPEHCSLCILATSHAAPPRVATRLRIAAQDKVGIPPSGQVDRLGAPPRTGPQPRAPPRD